MSGRDNGGVLRDGVKTGTTAAVVVTAAILAAGKVETGDMWGPLNDVSHVVLGEEKSHVDGFRPGTTLLGLALQVAAMESWGIFYHLLFGRPRFPKSVITAAVAAALIYGIDYRLLPRRFTPGFEHRLSRPGLFLIYAVLALTFLLANQAEE